jgi:hypothetical protein
MVWLLAGVLVGLGLASFWPAEELQAHATDRSDRFAITTVNVGLGFPDAVFVLDFLTGRLTGALLNSQSGLFTNFYFRNVAQDFIVDPNAKAKYAMIPGVGVFNVPAGGGQSATGVLYIGELTSGKVVAYRFAYRNSAEPINDVFTPIPIASYPFREAEPSK